MNTLSDYMEQVRKSFKDMVILTKPQSFYNAIETAYRTPSVVGWPMPYYNTFEECAEAVSLLVWDKGLHKRLMQSLRTRACPANPFQFDMFVREMCLETLYEELELWFNIEYLRR